MVNIDENRRCVISKFASENPLAELSKQTQKMSRRLKSPSPLQPTIKYLVAKSKHQIFPKELEPLSDPIDKILVLFLNNYTLMPLRFIFFRRLANRLEPLF